MIFAAGFGRRMGDLTADRPKPLLSVAGRTLLDRTRDLVREAGISRTVVNAHYLADQIAAHLQDTDCIVLQESPSILDTGGGLKAAVPVLGDAPVFTANPDVIWSGPNPFTFLANAASTENEATLLLVPIEQTTGSNSGDFDLIDGRPCRKGNYLYTGVQIIRPQAAAAERDTVFSLNRVWDRLIARDTLGAVLYPGMWHDVGSPAGLTRAEALFASSAV